MKIFLRIAFHAVLMILAVLALIGVAWVAYGALPGSAAIFVTFLGWVGIGIGWQTVAPRLQARLGL